MKTILMNIVTTLLVRAFTVKVCAPKKDTSNLLKALRTKLKTLKKVVILKHSRKLALDKAIAKKLRKEEAWLNKLEKVMRTSLIAATLIQKTVKERVVQKLQILERQDHIDQRPSHHQKREKVRSRRRNNKRKEQLCLNLQ